MKGKIYIKYVKRILDLIIAILGLICSLPFLIIFPIIIKCQSIGPVFFVQKRIGKKGKSFKILKFRTMVNNAEVLKSEFSEEDKAEFEKNFKFKNDTRVTKLGKYIRKTGLDEIPQLLNVLKGDMSIVGPRPVVPEEIYKYGEYKDTVFSIKPGLTGYWVANREKNTTYEERIQMDLYYNSKISFFLDTKIILKTAKNVICCVIKIKD